ncbi:MAG TPA: alpha/beta hydrolase [Dehalococcoidia bacterium]
MAEITAPALHFEVHAGNGPFLLLVHGILSSRAQWLLNIDALAQVSQPVVVELFGHGRSTSPEDPGAYTPASYVDQFERVRESVGAERWLICGQSLGAALTLRYALDFPERIIAQVFTNSNSALASDGWSESVRPAMEKQARELEADGRGVLDRHPLNPTRSRRLPDAVRDAFLHDVALLDPAGVARTGLYTVPDSSMRNRIASNRVPSLLIAGERETRFAPQRQFVEEAMPMLRVVGLDGGHAVNLDQPEQFNSAVCEFIREQVR